MRSLRVSKYQIRTRTSIDQLLDLVTLATSSTDLKVN